MSVEIVFHFSFIFITAESRLFKHFNHRLESFVTKNLQTILGLHVDARHLALFVKPWKIIKIWCSWSANDFLDCHLPCWDEQIWMKAQRNTCEPWTAICLVEMRNMDENPEKYLWTQSQIGGWFCPKLEVDRKKAIVAPISNRNLFLQLILAAFVCRLPMMCPTSVV